VTTGASVTTSHPTGEFLPYGRQLIDDDDIAAVVAVLKGDWLTQGPAVEQFEQRLTALTGAAHAVVFSSATAALHACCAAAGLGVGDRVAVPSLTFMASANCARYVGASPVLMDIDPATLNLDLAKMPHGVDAVVAVHYAGLPVDFAGMRRRPRIVIEDASHAIGAIGPDGPVGNCARSDLCVFSFHPVKTITSGEGGAVTTNDPALADRLRRFRSHDMVKTPERGGWSYEITELGANFRMTDMQAALGASQLAKLGRFVERRNELAARYRSLLADQPLVLPPAAPAGQRHAYHLFAVQVPERARVYAEMHDARIGVQVHYVPVHHHPISRCDEVAPGGLRATDRAYDGLLSLPLHPGLTDAQQDRVVDALTASLARTGVPVAA
jgi:perosamine synthetase